MDDSILFYEYKEKPFGCFSSFYICKIAIEGKTYTSSEAYFQSKKFNGPLSSSQDKKYAEVVASQNTGGKSAILARQAKPKQNYAWAKELWLTISESIKKGVKIRDDWEKVKNNIMREVVYNKFAQNKKLKNILLSSESKKLYEHTHRDSYWGDGCVSGSKKIGEGKSMLGKILEEVRYILDESLLSDRYKDMMMPKSKWIIPGLFILTDASNEKCIEKGFRFLYSSKSDYGCKVVNNVLIGSWPENLTPINKSKMIKVFANAISLGVPIALPFDIGEDIAESVKKVVYKM